MKRINTLSVIKISSLVLMLFIYSCGRVDLYQNLAEEDANEMLVLLSQNNIKADKKRVTLQNETSYTVSVSETDMVKARSLLLEHHLPRRQQLGLAGVYEKKGLIPTPDEQKARFLLAFKGEIINALQKIPQIVEADVVLNVPTKDEFADAEKQKLQRPTASVVVRVKQDGGGLESVTEPKIQQLVANAIEGMNPRDVAVIITYVNVADEKTLRPGDVKTLQTENSGIKPQTQTALRPIFSQEIVGLKLDPESKDKLKVYILIFFLLLVVLSTALIVVIVQGSRMRRQLGQYKGAAGEHPAIEGQVLNEGPPRLGGGGSSNNSSEEL